MKITSLASAGIRQKETPAWIQTRAMATPSSISSGTKGQEFCRPADWTDVAKFFLFNYGLHAFTTLSEPGDGILHSTYAVVRSILMPYSSIMATMKALLTTRTTDSLQRAAHSSALCMVLPQQTTPADAILDVISPTFRHVHGQIPVKSFRFQWKKPLGFLRFRKSEESPCNLVRVPVNGFTVRPPKSFEPDEPNSFELASNHSLLKALAGIFQVLYGSLELYKARGGQLEKYGYAAYSLTVIPYILMSLVNLLAAALLPQYPSMYVVLYKGKHPPDETTGSSIDEPARNNEPAEEPAGDDEPAGEPAAELAEKLVDKIGGEVGWAYGNLENRRSAPESPAPEIIVSVVDHLREQGIEIAVDDLWERRIVSAVDNLRERSID